MIGERVVHKIFGPGTVCDVDTDDKGNQNRFTMELDSGGEKKFTFPAAFHQGFVRLENGQEIKMVIKNGL